MTVLLEYMTALLEYLNLLLKALAESGGVISTTYTEYIYHHYSIGGGAGE